MLFSLHLQGCTRGPLNVTASSTKERLQPIQLLHLQMFSSHNHFTAMHITEINSHTCCHIFVFQQILLRSLCSEQSLNTSRFLTMIDLFARFNVPTIHMIMRDAHGFLRELVLWVAVLDSCSELHACTAYSPPPLFRSEMIGCWLNCTEIKWR